MKVRCIKKGCKYGMVFELPDSETPIQDAKNKLTRMMKKKPRGYEYEIL